jgi:hypothetical protein
MCHARLPWQRKLLIPLLVLFLTGPRVRAESPLEFIPEDAQIVARVKAPARVLQTVASWVPASSRDSLMPMVSDALNAMGQSADPAAECWVAQFFAKAGQKGWVYIVQANDVGKIKGSYTDAASHVTVGRWQVFAGTAALGARINDCKSGKISSLATAMDAKSRGVFDSGDVSVFINARKLRADYRNELDEWKRTVAAGLRPLVAKPAGAAGQPELVAPVGGGIYMARTSNEKLSEGLLALWYRVSDLIENTDCVAAGLKVDDKGAALEAYLAIAPKSRTDRFLARHPPSEMKPLELLPAGAFAYFGLAGDLTGMSRWLAQLKIATLERKGEGVDVRKQNLEPSWEGTVDGYIRLARLRARHYGARLFYFDRPRDVRRAASRIREPAD